MTYIPVRAKRPGGAWETGSAMDLDDQSFRLFVLQVLQRAHLVVGLSAETEPGQDPAFHFCAGKALMGDRFSHPASAWHRIQVLSKALRNLGGMDGGLHCWCEKRIGHPLVKDHLPSCVYARNALSMMGTDTEPSDDPEKVSEP